MKQICLLALLCLCTLFSYSQDGRFKQIQNQLESMLVDQPGLDERIETSVSGVPVVEYMRLLGIQHKLNISVASDIEGEVVNNFADARVADVLVFMCQEYSLDLLFIGDIITIRPYVEAPKPIPPQVIKLPNVTYDQTTDFVSLDLKRDSLGSVARQLTLNTPINVVLGNGLEDYKVSAFIQNRPLEDAIEKMCFSNQLTVKKEGSFFIIESTASQEEIIAKVSDEKTPPLQIRTPTGELTIDVNTETERISVSCDNVDIAFLIDEVSKRLDKNFFIYSRPEETISLLVENADYNSFLSYLFHGTDYSFIIDKNVYLIGNSVDDDIKTTELVQLQHRTIENVFGSFGGQRNAGGNNGGNNSIGTAGNPTRRTNAGGANPFLSPSLSIQPFPELNSFIVTGSYPEVYRFKQFIGSVDQVVPVVMIEVLIVDVNKNRTMSAGVNAGIGQNAGETTGTITGDANTSGLNVNLSTEDINDLVNSFNGFGLINLGNVSPNFYLSIQALESNGVLRTRSTPKLATLNSYTASLSIGQEEYYLETNSVVSPGTNATVVSEQQNWKSLNADLSIDITPIVSGEGQVTLTITVTQSDFTARSGENGPFGSVNREFSSSIRVMDGEMILLGGLEDKAVGESGSGLPGISRIPILKWFFGKTSRTKQETKLNIFIKPTIMY